MQRAPSSPGASAEPIAETREKSWAEKPWNVLLAVVVGFGILRAVVAATSGLTDDEAYYRLWALGPALSYLDHPPMVGWMIAIGRFIAGDNPLGVRLVAVLTSLIGPLVLWRSAKLLFGEEVAYKSVWFALAMPLMAVGGVIITPDTASVLFWGLAAWALAELYASRNANWWLAIGVFAGCGLLSKYTNLFVGAGIVLWLIWGPGNWRWLRAWQLWVGGVLAAAIASPVAIWNAQHEWASFAKQFGRVGRGQSFTLSYLGELIGGFFALASPLIAVLAVLGVAYVMRTAFRQRSQPHILVVTGLVPLLVYFLMHSLHDRVQANWLAPLYPTFAICAALAVVHDVQPWVRKIATWAVPLGFAMSALVYVHAIVPLSLQTNTKDPTAQMRGWPAVAAEVNSMREANRACWVATSSYATTGQLSYHLHGKAPVAQLDEPLRYLHMPPLSAQTLACPAVYVELERRASPDLLRERFGSVTPLGAVERRYRGVLLARYPVFLVAQPSGNPIR